MNKPLSLNHVLIAALAVVASVGVAVALSGYESGLSINIGPNGITFNSGSSKSGS